jgi:Mn-dependent DtxR family transcriptional regulator
MVAIVLPYRTEPRLLWQVLEYAKGKGIDRDTLEARLGSGEALREALNALEQLGLIERGDGAEIRLTDAGNRLAYAESPEERQRELRAVLLRYPPYGVPLERAAAEGWSAIESAWLERVWQVDLRLGQPRNRVEEARTFFFRLAEEAGFGTFRRGVRGQPSRLVLAPDFADQLAAARQMLAEPSAAATRADQAEKSERPTLSPTITLPASSPIALTITVDMSTWELEKIEAFLRMVGLLPLR